MNRRPGWRISLFVALLCSCFTVSTLQAAPAGKRAQRKKAAAATQASKPAAKASRPAATQAASRPAKVITPQKPRAWEMAKPATGPQPGEVYKTFSGHWGGNAWRVTDPAVKQEGGKKFLPNTIREIVIDDLKDAVRAEILIDRWGGHHGTLKKSISFNENPWLELPEIQNVPENPEEHMSQDNPLVEVPLEHLVEGKNVFEATCTGKWWGQWGLNAAVVRVYYDPAKKAHATAEIAAPANGAQLKDQPVIEVKPLEGEVKAVEVVGLYEDYDFDGNGVYREWAGAFFKPAKDTAGVFANHIGSDNEAPFAVTWDTAWLPDQSEPIEIVARVQDGAGVWSVTQPVTGLTLAERDNPVKLYKASEIPKRFGVRAKKTLSCKIVIPEDVDLSKAVGAQLYLRTWNGTNPEHGAFKFNEATIEGKGQNHHYALAVHEIPLDALKTGENIVSFQSDTKHHHLEVLWPGPGLVVKFKR